MSGHPVSFKHVCVSGFYFFVRMLPRAYSWRAPSRTWSSGKPDPWSSSAQRSTWSPPRGPPGLQEESECRDTHARVINTISYLELQKLRVKNGKNVLPDCWAALEEKQTTSRWCSERRTQTRRLASGFAFLSENQQQRSFYPKLSNNNLKITTTRISDTSCFLQNA